MKKRIELLQYCTISYQFSICYMSRFLVLVVQSKRTIFTSQQHLFFIWTSTLTYYFTFGSIKTNSLNSFTLAFMTASEFRVTIPKCSHSICGYQLFVYNVYLCVLVVEIDIHLAKNFTCNSTLNAQKTYFFYGMVVTANL